MLEQDYSYLINNIPQGMIDTDINVLVQLLCYIFGDLFQEAKQLPWEIDIDKCSDENLIHLSKLVKYPWNNALTVEQQRETIKYSMLIKRNRGTNFSYINLVRLFGKDSSTYYSSSDHSGVKVVEYNPEGAETTQYPGDIRVEVPEYSTILREALSQVQLMGTRLEFAYMLFLGALSEEITPDMFISVVKNISTDKTLSDNVIIRDFGPQHEFTVLGSVWDWMLVHPQRSSEMFSAVQLITRYVAPWVKGFLFNVPGLDNYRGVLQADGVLQANSILYR